MLRRTRTSLRCSALGRGREEEGPLSLIHTHCVPWHWARGTFLWSPWETGQRPAESHRAPVSAGRTTKNTLPTLTSGCREHTARPRGWAGGEGAGGRAPGTRLAGEAWGPD